MAPESSYPIVSICDRSTGNDSMDFASLGCIKDFESTED